MNSKGLAPHTNLTRWLEKGVELAMKKGALLTDSSTNTTKTARNFKLAQARSARKYESSIAEDTSLKKGITYSSISNSITLKSTNNNITALKDANVE